MTELYEKLAELPILRRAWQLVRKDSANDFAYDSLRYSDYGFGLDAYLQNLSRSLKQGSYRPSPVRAIDVPKSTLAVRPGTVPAIEDRIVLYAVALLIAPTLDKALPAGVYSYRVKSGATGDLFRDHQLLHFPFLKRRTIERRLSIIEPWYAQWPAFIRDVEVAYEDEGFDHLVVADISAYFENIDLQILRIQLLQHLRRSPKLVNFLLSLLEYWAWPSPYGTFSPRGIPQGNDVSSFLGNFYLLPLDLAFRKFGNRRSIRYLRYVDDVKVLTKDAKTARDALFLMNTELRHLRLTIQGAKTHILAGAEIRSELFDERLDEANEIVTEIGKGRPLTTGQRERYARRLREISKKCEGRRKVITGRELRLFRRVITGFTLLRHPGVLALVLSQLSRNPDSRLLASAATYLKHLRRRPRVIGNYLCNLLSEADGLFPYQDASFWMMLRYLPVIPARALLEAVKRLRRTDMESYVRQQAALLIAQQPLSPPRLDWLRALFRVEQDAEVRRAVATGLTQQGRDWFDALIRDLWQAPERRLQRLGRMLWALRNEDGRGKEAISSIFRDADENVVGDRLFELDAVAYSRHKAVRERLLKEIQRTYQRIRRPHLKERLRRLRERASRAP